MMDDLINREDAIKAVRESKPWHFNEIVPVLSAIKGIPSAENKGEWIPCSERLPEDGGEYLVTYHPCYWDRVEDGIKVGLDTFRGKTTWAKKKYQKVVAWMPLPDPWEGEDDERL